MFWSFAMPVIVASNKRRFEINKNNFTIFALSHEWLQENLQTYRNNLAWKLVFIIFRSAYSLCFYSTWTVMLPRIVSLSSNIFSEAPWKFNCRLFIWLKIFISVSTTINVFFIMRFTAITHPHIWLCQGNSKKVAVTPFFRT